MILNDCFDINYGQRCYHDKSNLIKNEGNFGTPLISSSGENNGLYGFYNIESFYRNVISVANTGAICSAFYHDYDCCIDDNCLVLKPKKDFTKQEMLYFTLLIQQEKYKYLYGRQVTPKRLGNTKIPNKIPEYVNKTEIKKPLHHNLLNKKFELDIKNWKSFTLDALFKITGSKTTKIADLLDCGYGKYPYITTQATNNGTEGFFNVFTESGNVLTIDSAVVGYCSYQAENFSASDHVEVLKPQFVMNKYVAMFFTTILNIEQYRFSYGRKASQTRLKNLTIKLPQTPQGEPDWEFMENYIKSLPYSSSL